MKNIEEVKVTGFTFSYKEALAVSEFIDKIITFCRKANVDYDKYDEVLTDVKTKLDKEMTAASADHYTLLTDEEFSVKLEEWIDF